MLEQTLGLLCFQIRKKARMDDWKPSERLPTTFYQKIAVKRQA